MVSPCEYCKKEAIHGVTAESCNDEPIGIYWFCDWTCLRRWTESVVFNWPELKRQGLVKEQGADNG